MYVEVKSSRNIENYIKNTKMSLPTKKGSQISLLYTCGPHSFGKI